jgi:hypothetical protein
MTTAAFSLLACIAGCVDKGVDSHTDVFKTADQIADARREKLLETHKELAVSVLKFSRPDLTVKPGAAGTIDVSADGLTQPIDLIPIELQMASQSNRERTVLRKYLDEQLRPFDQRRVRELGFEKLKPSLRYQLANGHDLKAMQTAAGTSKILSTQVVSDLSRAIVVQRPGGPIAVTNEIVTAWHTTPAAVDGATVDAMRKMFRDAGDKAFETTSYSSVGQTGTLRVDAAVIVLPEFLDAVHKAWHTTDDLILAVPSPRGAQFMESHNTRLAELVVPQWRRLLVSTTNSLYPMLLLDSKNGLQPYVAEVTTKPAPATKPKEKTYIVH